MDDSDRQLAELALERVKLLERLKHTAAEMKRLAKTADLPVCVEVDDYAVLVKKPQYDGGIPQTTTARLLRNDHV